MLESAGLTDRLFPRFPSSPLMIRVPFFLLFGLNKGNQRKKGKRDYWGT